VLLQSRPGGSAAKGYREQRTLRLRQIPMFARWRAQLLQCTRHEVLAHAHRVEAQGLQRSRRVVEQLPHNVVYDRIRVASSIQLSIRTCRGCCHGGGPQARRPRLQCFRTRGLLQASNRRRSNATLKACTDQATLGRAMASCGRSGYRACGACWHRDRAQHGDTRDPCN